MHRRFTPDQTIHPEYSLAHPDSVPFSDLRANPDTRLMRLWLDGETDGVSWQSIDIARGGLTVFNKLNAAEHTNTLQNANLLRQISRSAFALYQDDKLTDADGNLIAIALTRNESLQLGRMPHGHFDALRGTDVMNSHLTLRVDDDDMLAIEAYSDHLPQIEVIAADDKNAVQIGLARRDYRVPTVIGPAGVSLVNGTWPIEPLHAAIRTLPPQFPTISTSGPTLSDEQLASLLRS